jgi:hypothetical protein
MTTAVSGRSLFQKLQRFDSRQARHVQVEQHHIRPMLLRALDAFDAIGGVVDDFEIRLAL